MNTVKRKIECENKCKMLENRENQENNWKNCIEKRSTQYKQKNATNSLKGINNNGDIEFMTEHGWTLSKERKREANKSYDAVNVA